MALNSIQNLKNSIIKTYIFEQITAELKHQRVRKQLDKEFTHLIEKYSNFQSPFVSSNQNKSEYIWICWFQGDSPVSPIVKKCIEKVYENNQDKKIVLITNSNMESYVELSDQIKTKYRDGRIQMANMSDILRSNLLAKYGGCWIDATLLTFSSLPRQFYEDSLFSCSHERGRNDTNVSKGRWTSYLMGSKYPGNILFLFLSDFWNQYWSSHEELEEYFMIDYAIDCAYRNIPIIRWEIDQLERNQISRNPWELFNILYTNYDSNTMRQILNENWMQKLTYKGEGKSNFKVEELESTFYFKLIKGKKIV